MTTPKSREDSIEELAELQRRVSTRTVLFHQLIAERLGLGPTDHKCLDFALHAEPDAPISAGRLAELTGLTTGAITGVLDRLERGGFIRREKDPEDRRQVRIRVVSERGADIGKEFEPMGRAWRAFCARYTDDELETISRFSRDAIEVVAAQIERMRAEGVPPSTDEGVAIPLGAATTGQLVMRGATKVLVADTPEPVLIRAIWDGGPPRLRADRGEVNVQASGRGGRLLLTTAVPWKLRFRGGAVGLDVDLRRLTVEELDISGGMSDVKVRLGNPRGTVSVRVRGGAERLTILRPAGVPARVEVRGGASGVTLETLRLGDIGGPLRWATPDYERARERVDVEVSGGVDTLTVGVI